MVEFSPATREARVRFPDDATLLLSFEITSKHNLDGYWWLWERKFIFGPLYFLNESVKYFLLPSVAQWSRGMIPALGAGGPGFKSRLSPKIDIFSIKTIEKNEVKWAHPVGFEPTLPEGIWFLVRRLNHSAKTAWHYEMLYNNFKVIYNLVSISEKIYLIPPRIELGTFCV